MCSLRVHLHSMAEHEIARACLLDISQRILVTRADRCTRREYVGEDHCRYRVITKCNIGIVDITDDESVLLISNVESTLRVAIALI